MARRSFIFCDICNPLAIREVAMRRAAGSRSNAGRRISDGRSWFDGTDEEAREAQWITTSNGEAVCPACFERMRTLRHVMNDSAFVSPSVVEAVELKIDAAYVEVDDGQVEEIHIVATRQE